MPPDQSKTARQFLVDAQRAEARAKVAGAAHAAQLLRQARDLRAAAARIAEREAATRGGLPLFGQ